MIEGSPLPDEVVLELISRWFMEVESVSLLGDSTNSIYAFRSSGRDYILRVHRTGDRTVEEVKAELDWLSFLVRQGVRANEPFQSVNEQWVESACWDGNTLIAAVFGKVAGGVPVLYRNGKWRVSQIRQIGRLLGRIHSLNTRYERPAGIQRMVWPEIELARFAECITPAEDGVYLERLREYWEWMRALPRDDPTVFGLVHGDFHGLNLIARGSKVTAIDFDAASYNWFFFDMAHCIGMHAMEIRGESSESWDEIIRKMFQELMRGYIREHRIQSDWFEYFSRFLGGFQLMYYFNILARFQANMDKRMDVPHCRWIRDNILQNRAFSDLDFRTLYKEIQIPRWVRWFLSR